jgi:hypothetical protein
MNVIFMVNYFLVESDVSVNSETLLITDLVNLKIKPSQSFVYAHRSTMCVYRSECSYMYEYLYLYCVSKKIEVGPRTGGRRLRGSDV